MVDEAAKAAGYDLSHRWSSTRKTAKEDKKNSKYVVLFADIDEGATNAQKNSGYGENEIRLRSEDLQEVPNWATDWAEERFDWGYREADEALNPDSIVDGAGMWDNAPDVSDFWSDNEKRLIKEGIYGFKTPDGAVVFDAYSAPFKSADPVTYDESGQVIPLSERFNPASPSILYNPPGPDRQSAEAQDAEYMQAVAEGDMAKAKAMVNEAAKVAGYTDKKYHGTGEDFNVFKHVGTARPKHPESLLGWFFTPDEEVAAAFARQQPQRGNDPLATKWGSVGFASKNGRVIEAYLKLRNTLPVKSNIKLTGAIYAIQDGENVNQIIADLQPKQEIKELPEGYSVINGTYKSGVQWWAVKASNGKTFAFVRTNEGDAISSAIADINYRNRIDDRLFTLGLRGRNEKRSAKTLAKAADELRAALINAGYDSISIANDGEGRFIAKDTTVVLSPSAIKSADPVTYDESGEVIPLSERFNPASPSILYNPPGPARQSAEAQAAELEEAAARLLEGEGEPMSEAEDKAEVAELMRQLQDEQVRDTLMNDVVAIEAMEKSGAMASRNLSQHSRTPKARAFFRALVAAREALGGPEKVVMKEVRAWAEKQYEADPTGITDYVLEFVDDKRMVNVEESELFKVVIDKLMEAERVASNPEERKNIRQLAQKIAGYYITLGTIGGQVHAGRRDPLETPQDRWNKALSIVFGPREPARRRLRLAPSAAAKDRRIAELEAELEAAKAGQPVEGMERARRPQDVQADIAREQAKETQEDIIAEEDSFNEEAKKDVLKNLNVSEQDITFSAVDRYGFQNAILDLPSIREALDKYDEGRDIMRLNFRGLSDREIADRLGLNEADVAKFISDAVKAIIRPKLVDYVLGGKSFGDLLKDGVAKLNELGAKVSRFIGLQNPPGSRPLSQQGKKLTPTEMAAVQAQVDTILNFAMQPAARRNKAGSLISKIITTPNGKKARIFVPFDPDDEASFYAFAREFSTRKAKTFDKLYEYWINWPLLSGPQTQVANITGNAAQLAWHFTGQRLAEAAINMAYGAVGKGDPNSAQIGEFGTLLGAFYSSMGPALEMAKRAFLTEADSVRHRYLNEPLQIDLLASGNVDKVGQYGPAVGGKLGRLNRLPGRLLKFTDAFFKTAILHTEVATLAYRKAHAEAKTAGLKGKARKDYMRTEMAKMLNDPDSPIWKEAMDTAEDLLFQKSNDITDAVQTILGGNIQSENFFLQSYKNLDRKSVV
jgi:hypothetical protein